MMRLMHLLIFSQCCQGPEISAAELKMGPTKMFAAEKIGSRIVLRFSQKEAEKRPKILEDYYSCKKTLVFAKTIFFIFG
jgi:hypothetical protein